MRLLVTGSAGFIGYHLCRALLDRGNLVVGVDNLNDYYDPLLKHDRLQLLLRYQDFEFVEADIAEQKKLAEIFSEFRPTHVVNLAAQAGVRYSLKNPNSYVQANLVGFANILENARQHEIEHLVFASSSSVYGANKKYPFQESDRADHPLALYGATKKANEVMAHSYAHLFGLPCTGLRFFTVYGPWGRPDMALFKFTRKLQINWKLRKNK